MYAYFIVILLFAAFAGILTLGSIIISKHRIKKCIAYMNLKTEATIAEINEKYII